MLERRRARTTWALGLIVVLCSYNLAYANVKIGENTGAPPAKVRTIKLNDDSATKTIATDKSTTPVQPNKKNVPTVKNSKTGATSCACSCSAKTGRAAAAPGPWWDCVKGCLRSWGVSIVQLAFCGVACATANVPICIACLAISISLLMFCSTGCSIYATNFDTSAEGHEPILVRKLPRNNRQKAERPALASAARK